MLNTDKFLAFISAVLFILPTVTQAQWVVQQLKGDAWVDNPQNAIKKGQEVKTGQTVVTAPRSRLELRQQNKVIFLGGSSKLLLKPQSDSSAPPSIDLLRGQIRAKMKKTEFQVITPAAVMGVRGTEFFVSSERGRDFVCTLEGLVDVESKSSGQKVLVPPRTGVQITEGQPMSLGPTPEDQVAKWVNDTDAKKFTPVVMESYGLSDMHFHSLGRNLYWGFRASLNITATEKLAYSALDTPPSLRFLQSRISPALRFGNQHRLTWIPRLLIHNSNEEMILDGRPLLIERKVEHLDLGELFGETSFGNTRLRLGYQTLNWDNGFYFSNNFWQLAPSLFPALRLNSSFGRNFIELVGIRRGDVGRLNSQTPVDMLLFKFDHSNWLSVFAGHRDYTQTDSEEPVVSRGHRVDEVGSTVSRRSKRFDFKAGGMVQKGSLFAGTQDERPFNAKMVDVQVGYYPLKRKSLRIGLQWIEASENFLPGFENPYNLGFSQILKRTNVTQYRAKISFAPRQSDWTLFLEGIRNYSVGTGQFTAWSGDRKQMLDEVDLSWSKSWEPSIQTIVSAIWFNPTAAMSATSPTWSQDAGAGFMIYSQYTY